MKKYTKIEIKCTTCGNKQLFCNNGMPLSGLCTLCRKKKFKKDNKPAYKSQQYCKLCNVEVGKNSNTLLCKKCYVSQNKEKIKTYANIYNKTRYKNDPYFRISKRLRSRLSHAVREYSFVKSNISSISDLGCSVAKLKIHLQLKFHRNPANGQYMTWNNYGEWEIDHIKPLSKSKDFNLALLCHYTNLQPLWARQNRIKSNKLTTKL